MEDAEPDATPGVAQPYLSIVATSRNDDHGGNLLGRMQVFIDNLLEQCRRRQFDCELILVEWNPPADRPRLADALHWPADPGPCRVRIIEVPPDVHARFQHADNLPLFQMIAKNVGIRRARGEFVLATNIDILFSNTLFDFLAARHLATDCLYRVDRHDVDAELPPGADVDARLSRCADNVIRVNRRDGTYFLRTSAFDRIYKSRLLLAAQMAAVILAVILVLPYLVYFLWPDFKLHATIKRFARRRARTTKRFTRRQVRSVGAGVGIVAITPVAAAVVARAFARFRRIVVRRWHRKLDRLRRYQRHLSSRGSRNPPDQSIPTFGRLTAVVFLRKLCRSIVVFLRKLRRSIKVHCRRMWHRLIFEFTRPRLHTNACGDFTLLARNNWNRLRGYAEFEMYSFHIDGLLCHAAARLGIRERVLENPACVYHMEHAAGSGFTPEGQKALWRKLRKTRVRRLSDDELWTLVLDIHRRKRPPTFNGADWGLADGDFKETTPMNGPGVAPGAARVASTRS